jgi:predicted small integral membrane protein
MVDWISVDTSWMYWTWQSGLTLGGLFAAIALMGIWDGIAPSVPRKGFLPIRTTRGDRFFIGIISLIAVFLIWLGIAGDTALWIPLAISLGWFAAEGGWG